MNPLKSKADLHIHSRHSTRAADWVLRRLEFPASYSDPLQLYKRLREIGMDFVTITDHNTIAGCLEIAHLPGVIFGEEVTANFPDDECKVHILVWGLTETQHREIQLRRDNVFELQRYLADESLAHAVAHPLHSPDEKLTPLHFQKLALIFRHFEGINGRYHARLSDAMRYALHSLTPSSMEAFVARTWNRADPRAAMEKDLHRRLRRSWWRLSGASVDRSAIVPSRRGLLDQYPGGQV